MLGPIDYFLWFSSAFLEAAVVVCAFRSRSFLRYLTLNVYMLAAFVISAGRFFILVRHGWASPEYAYFYYYSDALGTILLYFAIMGFYQLVLEEMRVSRYIRGAAIFLLAATACFSYAVVQEHTTQLTTRFVLELSQNMYFVGVVLNWVLWGALLKLRETRLRIIHLVLTLGIYFSGYAASFAFLNMFPQVGGLRLVMPVLGTLLPLAWVYTFTKVPEEARLATARVAPTHR